jgi:hypothetical protein
MTFEELTQELVDLHATQKGDRGPQYAFLALASCCCCCSCSRDTGPEVR